MFGTQDLTLFIISGLLLNVAPGPDSLLIMARSASQGWRAGSAAALGIGTGTFVHVLAAALGLSALMAASSWAFGLVKLLGAAYLVYMGLGLLLKRAAPESSDQAPALPTPRPLRSIYLQGLLTNVLNPKVALFFLAFVPQFIAPDAASKPLAFVFLGLVFNVNGMLWCHFLAWSTAQASRRISASRRVVSWLNRAIGALFLGFGLKLALTER
ncbi:LysE family translocator [Roseateles sp.]|uniref:LysE family translocator n=1 Tax=Roseateles sp. TaxID=1971397 RepID=UPI003D0A2DA4